jgi:hypothetical protein
MNKEGNGVDEEEMSMALYLTDPGPLQLERVL